ASVDGMRFDLDLAETIDVATYLAQYERDVVRVIESVCRPGWHVFDIGANIGAHTLRFCKIVGASGRVYAFEPIDYAYRKLLRNISLNSFSNVIAAQIALSDQNLLQQLVGFRASWLTDGGRVETANRADCRRLDDWCAEHDVNAAELIKLDVDGGETGVLNGARRLLERCRPVIIMESTRDHFKTIETNPLTLLDDLGYGFYHPVTGLRYAD